MADPRRVAMPKQAGARPGVDLDALRARVRAIERGGEKPETRAVPLGLAELDGCLAGGGIALGRVHEVVGEARSEVRDAASFGFTAALLSRILSESGSAGEVLWCPRAANRFGGALSARGLAWFGLDPGRIIQVAARDEVDRLWAMEEGLGCADLAAVVVELGPVRSGARDSTICRRLQLAAEASGVTGFLLRPDAGVAAAANATPESRWRVVARPSLDWRPCWQADLIRARNGRHGSADVIWDAEWRLFRPAPGMLDEDRAGMKPSEASRAVPAERLINQTAA